MKRDFDPYKILDVEKDASIDNIKKSFKQKSKVMHPDTGGSIDQFNTLKKAYDILIDASKREIWDEYRIADDFNIEDEAKTVAIQIVLPVLDTFSDNCNLDEEIKSIISNCIKELTDKVQDLVQKRERLENRLKTIYKKPQDDFISCELEKMITMKDTEIRQHKLNLKIHNCAFELLKEYQFDTARLSSDKKDSAKDYGKESRYCFSFLV